jgi:hypothetical protein
MQTTYKGLAKRKSTFVGCMFIKCFVMVNLLEYDMGAAITTSWLNTYEHLEGIRCILMKC